MKHRVLHLHTDPKFLYDSLKYQCNQLENELMFIGQADEKLVSQLDSLKMPYTIVARSESEIPSILERISQFDALVVNDFCKFKTQLISQLESVRPRVFLRLFGYELYIKVMNKYISKTSLVHSSPITLKRFTLKAYVKRRIKRLLNLEYTFNKAEQKQLYSKIDAIFLHNQFEYDELKRDFYLPPFIQLPLVKVLDQKQPLDLSQKKDQLIIGNSRIVWNNHLDVQAILNQSQPAENVKFIYFFSYGAENAYTEAIKKNSTKNCVFIEDFMPYEEFAKCYQAAAAVVINSYRQHALGNIFEGMLSGCKLYLNEKSSTYKWLKQEGFTVSSIVDLKNDINANRFKLTQQEAQNNLLRFQQLQNQYTTADFIGQFIRILEAKKPN